MKVILAALKIEVSVLLKKMRLVRFSQLGPLRKYHGYIEGKESLIAITGMGREYVHRSMKLLLKTESPSHLLSIGYAGGLDPSLQTGDVAFIRSVQGPGPPLHLETKNPFSLPKFDLYTSDSLIRFPKEKLDLHQRLDVHIVEMESYYLVQQAFLRKIPITCLRVVLDTQQEHLQEFDFLAPDGQIFFRKLFAFLKKDPNSIWILLELQKKGSTASRKIAQLALDWLKHD